MAKRKYGDEDLDKIMSSEGRLQDQTLKRRQTVLDEFKKSLKENESFDELIEKNDDAKKQLEKAIVRYLSSLTIMNKITGKVDVPKANTLNFHISNLKCALSEITNYDFGDKNGKKSLLRIKSDLEI